MIFEYKVKARHGLGWKEFKLYADTDIEEFFNRNSINYVRNMTDTVEHRLLKEIERLNNIINEINSIVEYWGYDKEHNDISSFRMAMKNIKDILGSDKE